MNATQLGPILGYMVLNDQGRPMRKDPDSEYLWDHVQRATIFRTKIAARIAINATWNQFDQHECSKWTIIRIYGSEGRK